MNFRRVLFSVAFGLSWCGPLAPSFADPAGAGGNPAAGKAVYQTYCAVCHGNEGRGNGPGAAGLNPKPKNFSDPAVMAKLDDATRAKAVSEGGGAVGVSPAMPPFKEALSEQQIRDVLAYVKQFAK